MEHLISRAGVAFVFDFSKISDEIKHQLMLHGATQKIGDAAANSRKAARELMPDGKDGDPVFEAKVTEVATNFMAKVADSLYSGEWTSRTAGETVDEFTKEMRILVRAALKTAWGKKSPKWAEFTGLSDEKQNERIDQAFSKNEAHFLPLVEKRIAEKIAEREEAKKLQSALSGLDL
jgi:hypothetical protein